MFLGPRFPTPVLAVPPGQDAGIASVDGTATSPSPAPQAYTTVTVKPSGSPTRLLKVGAVVLISGAVLLLFGAIGAFYFWKGNDNHVSSTSDSPVGMQGPPGAQGGRTPRWSQSAARPAGTACCSLWSPWFSWTPPFSGLA